LKAGREAEARTALTRSMTLAPNSVEGVEARKALDSLSR
jgi:hypothetical protein